MGVNWGLVAHPGGGTYANPCVPEKSKRARVDTAVDLSVLATRFRAWLWPDRAIGKREARRLREEQNALFNSHCELLEAVKLALPMMEAIHEVPPRRARLLRRAIANATVHV